MATYTNSVFTKMSSAWAAGRGPCRWGMASRQSAWGPTDDKTSQRQHKHAALHIDDATARWRRNDGRGRRLLCRASGARLLMAASLLCDVALCAFGLEDLLALGLVAVWRSAALGEDWAAHSLFNMHGPLSHNQQSTAPGASPNDAISDANWKHARAQIERNNQPAAAICRFVEDAPQCRSPVNG